PAATPWVPPTRRMRSTDIHVRIGDPPVRAPEPGQRIPGRPASRESGTTNPAAAPDLSHRGELRPRRRVSYQQRCACPRSDGRGLRDPRKRRDYVVELTTPPGPAATRTLVAFRIVP